MSGSIKWFVYVADDNEEFAYKADESNTEAVVAGSGQAAGTGDFTATSTAIYSLPRNLKPRRVRFRSVDGTKTLTVICPTDDVYAGVNPGDTITVTDPLNGGAIVLQLVQKIGENIVIPFAGDTGLQDGDAT